MNCEHCGTEFVDRVHTERYSDDMIEEVYVCQECPAEFVARYDMFHKELTEMGEQMVEENV
jgi:protein-arginine kinase activator protein McsA